MTEEQFGSESEGLLPKLDPLPSSITPGDLKLLELLVSSIDRHTAAMTRIASAIEDHARAHQALADRAREWAEKTLPWDNR